MEDRQVKSGAGKNTAATNDAANNAATNATTSATAWEIPSGKKRKQKGKQRRNTQTITMEGAQVDSSQLYQVGNGNGGKDGWVDREKKGRKKGRKRGKKE